MGIRMHAKKGEAWWTDISLKHAPDFEGNVYRRVFVEQTTGRVVLTFSKKKDTVSLLRDLDTLRAWVSFHVTASTGVRLWERIRETGPRG